MRNIDKLLANATYGKAQTINLNIHDVNETKIDRYFRYGMYVVLTWASIAIVSRPRYFR